MSLQRLVAEQMQKLSGSEFKVAAYLYWRLETRRNFKTTIDHLQKACGLSWRQTQTALKRLSAKPEILHIESRTRGGTVCMLPQPLRARRAETPRKVPVKSVNTPLTQQPETVCIPPAVQEGPPPVPVSISPLAGKSALPQHSPPNASLPGSTANPENDRFQQAEEVQELVHALMHTTGEMKLDDFQYLVQAADGNLDRLLRRLQRLLNQYDQSFKSFNGLKPPAFDNFRLLCSEIRRMIVL